MQETRYRIKFCATTLFGGSTWRLEKSTNNWETYLLIEEGEDPDYLNRLLDKIIKNEKEVIVIQHEVKTYETIQSEKKS